MDLLTEMRNKLSALAEHPVHDGVRAAIRHIEVAERRFEQGRDDRDENHFNDVVYRSNQAYEGMLKEVYSVLTGNDTAHLTLHGIEQHLLNEEVFTPRVFDLFKNYRQQWRNPSTHDHKLFFNEQEALLTIVRVSAFAVILLDQLIEVVSFQQEQQEAELRRDQLSEQIKTHRLESLSEEVSTLLTFFGEELLRSGINMHEVSESELMGRLAGFIEGFDPGIRTMREPTLTADSRLRPDFLMERGDDQVLVELKRAGLRQGYSTESGKQQLLRYLEVSSIKHGILFIPPISNEDRLATETVRFSGGTHEYTLTTIAPSGRKEQPGGLAADRKKN